MDVNWNKFNLKVGDTCIVDADHSNRSEVIIIAFSIPNEMFVEVKAKDSLSSWTTMTKRLTPILNE